MKKDTHVKRNSVKRNIIKEKSQSMQDSQVNDNDRKEQRRTARIASVIGLIAVLGMVFSFFLKIVEKATNIYPNQNLYKIFLTFVYLAFAGYIFIFLDIMQYIKEEMMSYNLLDEEYEKHDKICDRRYFELLNDTKIYIFFLIAIFFSFGILLVRHETGWEKYVFYIFMAVLFALELKDLCGRINILKGKEAIETVVSVGKRIICWGIIAIILYYIVLLFSLNNAAAANVSCHEDGTVEISNISSGGYDNLEIFIYDESDGLIYETKSVKPSNLMTSYEEAYVGVQEGAETITGSPVIDQTIAYWKYSMDLSQVSAVKSGKYMLEVIIYQGTEKIILKNQFTEENGKYIFARNQLEKEY
ncbi:hypothetical protein B5F29_01200 [Lachnoclostridium sp. An196]|uniref:hypothetical protein n=1 Tax=Lachnoclostridium sp. An196 TaxID=1965583 RepID=UPI000B37B330|nr:hypothetical protein [Lachnoclostridium sp. An196]OUP22387.1 hypothetical protein B5F29_01200 [Lachnoclostridium sp. An196]